MATIVALGIDPDRLHALVGAGRLAVEQAQQEIAADWIAAYVRYFARP